MGKYDRLTENANVFDRNRSWAGIRKERTGTGKTTNTQIVYDDVLCHNGWGVGPASDELMHYGISGMKWGIRRFQNADGTLTPAGKERYGVSVEEVKKKLDAARLKEHEAKVKYEKKQNRVLPLNPFEPMHSGKKYAKAMKQANKIDKIYQNMPKDTPVNLIGGAQNKSIGQKIKDHFEAQFYPPEMRGKSKEEKKAWEQKEREKFERESAKERTELNLGKMMNKIDKLSPAEQDAVRKQVKSEIDSLLEKNSKRGGLGHDDDKKLDGLADWYMQDCDKRVKQVMAPLDKPFDNRVISQDEGQVQLHKNPKYENLYKHVLESTKKESDANREAAGEYNKKKDTASNIKLSEANFKYWTSVSQSTLDYVKKNFPAEERDRALAFVLWNLYD